MLEAAATDQESKRLRTLQRLALVGVTRHPRYDRITHTAALTFKVPTAGITLISDTQLWVLSYEGQVVQSAPRKLTLSAHAIAQGDEAFVIEDTHRDERFADNPYVTGPPHARFFAACPLYSLGGFALGTLFLLDSQPRQFDQRNIEMLCGLAAWAQSELNAFEREHNRLEAAKSRLVAPAVHQIRGALTSIHGFSGFLLEQETDEAQRRELLTTIHEQSDQLASFINELVDLFHIEATAGRDVYRSSQRLPPLLRNVVSSWLTSGQQLRATLELDETLPAVMADPIRVQQALLQLLSNAVGPTGTAAEVLVTLKAAERPGFAALTVHDRLHSLKPEQMARVFDPFFRANRYDLAAGPGFGLALVKEIAALHGGEVLASSHPGQGTAVTLLLPFAD